MSPIGWVVPGPLRQVTGGYLYDARIVDGLRAAGWSVGVLDIRSRRSTLDFPAARRLVSGLARERWSAVVMDELAHPALGAALLTGRLRPALGGAPLVLLVHHLRLSEPAPWRQRAVARLIESLAARAADLIICTSQTTAQTVRPLTRPGVQVAVVRPGWDTHSSPDMPSTPLLPSPHAGCADWGVEGRSRKASSRPALSLLLVGHWTPRKGILAALTALERADPAVTLDLVGEQDRDAAYASQVRALLQSPALAGRVQVHGRVSDQELARLYAQADVLLLPSTHEGYGMVLAEALAAGLPIIATRVGAVPEVVRDGQEAILVLPGDTLAMARAMDRLARRPDERQRRAALARERAAVLPGWSDSLTAFQDLLTDLLRTSGTPVGAGVSAAVQGG